jgi:threonine aldolase
MFGGSLRQAWPCAAVALHYLDGFCERFGQAVDAAETLFRAIGEHQRCQILRTSVATNVAQLSVHGSDAAGLPQRLLTSGISIRPALHSKANSALFELITNETILRRPVAETIEIFLQALRSK